MFAFGLVEALGFLLVLMIILRILMKDYDKIYEESVAEENSHGDPAAEGSSGWFSRFNWIKKADTPEDKAKAVFNILGGLCILVIGVLAITSASADRSDSLIPFIFSDNWTKGINLFAIAKIVRYSDIHKVNNLSRSNSWCIAEFTVKNNVDTEALKKLFWTELPEIKERHKEILSDPVFIGISSINTGSITFGIRAECKESRMRKVRSILNYEIRDILNKNNIDML